MKTSLRGLAPALLAACLLGLSGCGADNETEADRLQKGTGAPPTTEVKGTEVPKQASSYAEYTARQKAERSQDPRQSNYAKSVGGYKADSAPKK